MNMKFAGVVFLIVGSVPGCATAPARLVARGSVVSKSPGARLIVAGPVTVHAYAGFEGGEIYNTSVVTGADADCSRIRQGDVAIPVPADRIVSVAVPAGAAACLHTWDGRGYELVWHSVESQHPAELAATPGGSRVR